MRQKVERTRLKICATVNNKEIPIKEIYQLSRHTPKFRYAAKVTQSK